MLGDQSLPSKDKIPKRAPDLNTGSSKRRKQNETDKNGTAFPQQPEIQGSSSDRVSPIPSPESMDIDEYQDSATTSQENMDTSTEGSDTPTQELIDLQKSFAENVLLVDVDFSKKASKEEAGLSKVLEAETAMRNTCGGVIILNIKNKDVQQGFFANRDKWQSKLEEMRNKKLSQVQNPDTFDEILDFKDEELSLIFVRKSSIVLTEESKCILQRCETRNQRVTSYPEICSILKSKKSTTCSIPKEKSTTYCCSIGQRKMTSFILDKKMPFPESKTAEFKHLTGNDLPTSLRKELRDNIVAFANTTGGTVYFGIKDDASILGQKVNNEEHKNICRYIEECMCSKLWIKDSGDEIDPVKDCHYGYDFFPVDGAEDNTCVIEIHICKFAGTVFSGEPISPVLNEANEIVNMDFKKWWALHKSSLTGNSDYQKRFVEKKHGTSTYFSVKETVEKIVADLTSASEGQLKLHPSHAVQWIKDQALEKFVDLTRKAFHSKCQSGIAYIERCWEVNLGLPSTKPNDVICDALLCCPQMPLVFVTLTQSDIPDEASRCYNRKVAARLKATLVQEADCLEKFYVKPVVISHRQLLEDENLSWIYSESPRYPEAYRMNNNTYSSILEALVLVLARANMMSSHIVGQEVFNLLTCDQYKILHKNYNRSKKVEITGPPGSGKTVLALERINRLRNEGCSHDEVLFLCSNKPLKARVKNKKTCDGQSLCIVKTYYDVDSLIQSVAGFNIELGNVKHILADEAQNFQEGDSYLEWWSKLHALCDAREDSSFWVFFDVAQKINNKRSVSLRTFPEFELTTVIRQTGNVHRFITSKYMRVDPQVELGHDFDGPKVDVLVPFATDPTKMHLVYILILRLHKLIVKDGHHMNEITVLFNDGKQKELYQSLFVQRTNNSCPVRNGEEVKKQGVVFDTIRRYCGVDDNIIIGFCPEYYTSGFQNNDALMTALCSRTKLKLVLILENAEVAKRFDLAPAELKCVKVRNMREVINFPRQ